MSATLNPRRREMSATLSPRRRENLRAYVWIISATCGTASSWYLMVYNGYNHPYHLHLVHALCAIAASTYWTYAAGNASPRTPNVPTRINDAHHSATYYLQITWLMLGSLSLAGSMLLLMKALYRTANPPVLMLLLPMAFIYEAVGKPIDYGLTFKAALLCWLRVSLAFAGCIFVVWDDYRPTADFQPAIYGFTLLGISKAFIARARSDRGRMGEVLISEWLWKIMLKVVLPTSLVLTVAVVRTLKDRWTGFYDLARMDGSLLAFNIITSTTAILTGGSLMAYSYPDNSLDEMFREEYFPGLRQLFCGLSFAMLSVLLYPTVVTISQILATTFAFLCFIIPGVTISRMVNGRRARSRLHALINRNRLRLALYHSLVPIFCFLLATAVSTVTIATRPSDTLAKLDCEYIAPNQFEIVVSMYTEPPSSVGSTLSSISAIPAITALAPRVHIYTKDPNANLAELQNLTGAHQVTPLPNIGREGHTFLHHILTQWGSLAAQTLFIQAAPHETPALLNRLRDYYTPRTGMLALGNPSGVTCACASCTDQDWRDDTNKVAELHMLVSGAPCTRALLSYRGQFVASAARIRIVGKTIYESLNRTLVDPDSWAMEQEGVAYGRNNTLDAPLFGYTLERLWGVLMQCSTDRVAQYCPALNVGRGWWGKRRDCACEDVCEASGPMAGLVALEG